MPSSRSIVVVSLLAAAHSLPIASRGAEPTPVAPLGFLLGSSDAVGAGKRGEPTGGGRFREDLQGRVAAAPGPRFRLTYRLGTDGIIAGSFEIAPPGKPDAFGPYLTWSLKSAGKAA